MSKEADFKNDMVVGAVVRVLEKYGILRRGLDDYETEDEFKGRGLILLQNKMLHSKLAIDWKHQELLKTEAYFKLDQIKRLLFYPSCRKRFILEYFGDDDDLVKL
jgi:hypothetical protein